MRGSVYYQTAELAKAIFQEGAKKHERIDPEHPYYQCVASYKTMETYRSVWNNFGNYLKEHWGIKDFERILVEHVRAYFEYKIEYYPTRQYAEKLSTALGKLEIALQRYTANKYDKPVPYNFKIRQELLNHARRLELVADGYHNRVYREPETIITNLSTQEHRLAASIQLYGGARSEGVTLIRPTQMTGIRFDEIAGDDVGVIKTKEKGGKEGDVLVPVTVYKELETFFAAHSLFRISYQAYANDIRETCKKLGIKPEGSHGFRWTFAQNRIRQYQKHGFTYEQALQGVSWEMKHHRASISEHYLV